MDPIAACVLGELQRRGMTMSEVADRAGTHRSVVWKWLSGRRKVRVDVAARVMKALQIRVEGPTHEAHHPRAAPARPARR